MVPAAGLAGLRENFRNDLVAGFIVFLIALPLCLGIACASGCPPVAGVIAAVCGGLIVPFVGGSHVTVNGPAAGLIVVILAAVDGLGGGMHGYHCALAAVVVSGLALSVAGALKAGALCELFPASVVHGMLGAIGIIIMSKQVHVMLGVTPEAKEPLALIAEIPHSLAAMNPAVAMIGILSLALMAGHSFIKNQKIRRIPAPLIVIAVSLALSFVFDLSSSRSYDFLGRQFVIDGSKLLVQLPLNVYDGITHPDFSMIGTRAFWLAVISITLVQGIETLLSGAAVDSMDRYRRRSDLSRDLTAVGAVSALSGMLGGLPVIAEIVRSTANIDNGARTRWSNFFHGLFMLVSVLSCAALLNRIPLAALAALLVFTGYRLASPRVLMETHRLGREQTVIFVVTALSTLATDLLVGVAIGIATKLALHVLHGAATTNLFSAHMEIHQEPDSTIAVAVSDAVIFSNYMSLKQRLDSLPAGSRIRLDLSKATLIDHTVMERLEHFRSACDTGGGQCVICGLDGLAADSEHPMAARRLPLKSA